MSVGGSVVTWVQCARSRWSRDVTLEMTLCLILMSFWVRETLNPFVQREPNVPPGTITQTGSHSAWETNINDSFTHWCSRQPNKYMYTAPLVDKCCLCQIFRWLLASIQNVSQNAPPPTTHVCTVSDGEKSCVRGVTMASLHSLFLQFCPTWHAFLPFSCPCVSPDNLQSRKQLPQKNVQPFIYIFCFLCFAIRAPRWHLRVWLISGATLIDSTMRCNKQRLEHKQKQGRDTVKRKLSIAVLLFTAQLLLLLLLCR